MNIGKNRIPGPVLMGLMLASLGSNTAVQAQPRPVAPGLWESRMTNPEMAAAMARMQADLAKMPAAQRAQMEKMMGGHGGAGKDGATHVCLTPDMIKTDPNSAVGREGCKNNVSWSGNVAHIEFACQNGEKGKGEFTYSSDKAYSGWMEAQGISGKSTRMTMESKWVSADCGAVKPVKLPTK